MVLNIYDATTADLKRTVMVEAFDVDVANKAIRFKVAKGNGEWQHLEYRGDIDSRWDWSEANVYAVTGV